MRKYLRFYKLKPVCMTIVDLMQQHLLSTSCQSTLIVQDLCRCSKCQRVTALSTASIQINLPLLCSPVEAKLNTQHDHCWHIRLEGLAGQSFSAFIMPTWHIVWGACDSDNDNAVHYQFAVFLYRTTTRHIFKYFHKLEVLDNQLVL